MNVVQFILSEIIAAGVTFRRPKVKLSGLPRPAVGLAGLI